MTRADKSVHSSRKDLHRGEAIELAERLLAEAGIASALPSIPPDLPTSEVEALAAAGLRRSPDTRHWAQQARLRHACTLLDLFAASDPPTEVARRLGVSARTVQRRVREGSLCSVEVGGVRRVPRFQFEGDSEVPGLRKVLAAAGLEGSPVSFAMWFLSPSTDLALGAEAQALSPREWLLQGGAVDIVANHAADLCLSPDLPSA